MTSDDRIKWDVRINFEDGPFDACVEAETRFGAFRLALQESHPLGGFMSPVLSWDAAPAEMEVA